MAHFVLIHGACHGAWCWYKLVALLRSTNHRVTAMDLASSGIDSRPADDVRSISDYYNPLMELMASIPAEEKVILVGNSAGGLGVSVAMETFPDKISVAVFVTAFMHGPSLTSLSLYQEIGTKASKSKQKQHRPKAGPKRRGWFLHQFTFFDRINIEICHEISTLVSLSLHMLEPDFLVTLEQ